MRPETKRRWAQMVTMLLFLLTSFNLWMYPENPKGAIEWLLWGAGAIIWISPIVVFRLVYWSREND